VRDPQVPLGDAVRGRIRQAEAFGPGDYPQALRDMAARRREFAEWFEAYDAILLPSVPIPAIPWPTRKPRWTRPHRRRAS
jgi:aspartyl-tRNA(Asn)/glutamyl-tRNA(Gln) amidotransferase subunit A